MKRIYVDMDDTIANYSKRWKSMRELYPNQKYPQSELGFFVKLLPIDDAVDSVKSLSQKHEVWFLSRPSVLNVHSYTEKAEWILKHFGQEWMDKLVLCTDKRLLKGDILIDDSTENGNSEFDGEFIHFGKGRFCDWNAVLKHISEFK